MNKKSTMIFIVMLLAASAAGLVLLKYYGKEEQHEPGGLEKIVKDMTESVNDSCVDFEGFEKARCYLGAGDLNKSAEACGNMSGADRNRCYQSIAVSITRDSITNINKSISLCDKMSEGWFFCYVDIASVAFRSDRDAAIFLCNLTYPMDICYSTLSRVSVRMGLNETLVLCNKLKSGVCYTSAATIIVQEDNDSARALPLCRECVNNTGTCCGDCYLNVAREIVIHSPETAIDVCNEGAEAADKYGYTFSYMCQLNAAEIVMGYDANAAFEICRNLTGINRGSCYVSVVKFSNNSEHITEMCSHIISIWGEDPAFMRYCSGYV